MKILNQEIKEGETYQLAVEIARLPSRTQIEIPVIVSRAMHPGPVVLLTAGLHGDEINGVEILRRIIAQDFHKPLRGTIITIPLVNIYGFLNYTRELPDGKDINRMFPGSMKGSLASRIAYRLMHDIIPFIDFGIDFHTGGESRANFPQIRCYFGDSFSHNLAKVFHAPFTLNSNYREKSFRKSAFKSGKNIILFEGGESMRLDEFVINEGVNGTLRVLNHFNMSMENPLLNMPSVIIKKSFWVRARFSGIFQPVIENGTYIRKNEIIGSIKSPFGDFEKFIRAPANSYVICINNFPLVTVGEALFHLGMA